MSASLYERFKESRALEDCPIYDLHGHWGPFYGSNMPVCEPETAIRYLNRSGVKLLVFCSHQALFSPDISNAANIEAVRAYPHNLRAYCGINPNYPDIIANDLATYDDYPDVYVGLKLLPPYHGAALTDERYVPAWEFANERGLLVLTHTWASCGMCGPEPLKSVLETYPNVRLLLGHSLHGSVEQAVEVARAYPNAYLELTAILDDRGVLDQFAEQVGSERIVYGTDFPWFGHPYYIGAVMGAEMTDEDRRNILYRNAQRLLGIEPTGPWVASV